MLGETIGLYKILEELGSGGFGTVYTARHIRTNEIVAVKVLRRELCARADLRGRLLQEAQALRALPAHPNIVGLRDFGEAHGLPYLVMDYLPGQDLRDLMADAALPVDRALAIAAQVADALAAAERGGLVHCDIKPENLRILPGDGVRVMDFGIARAVDSRFREIAGTRAYMAPELWRGDPPEPASDVYALGCVLYEMLAGRPPFVPTAHGDAQRARREVEQQHQTMEPDWWPLQQEAAPPELLDLLKAMLAKAAGARPKAGPLASALRRVGREVVPGARLAGETVVDDDATRPYAGRPCGGDDDRTVVRPLQTPSTPPSGITPSGDADLERLSTGVRVSVQRHLASLDLGAEACRAAICHDGALVTGTLAGQIFRLDLRTGRVQRWDAIPRSAVRSPAWAFAARQSRLWLHAGDRDCFEVDASRGQVVGRTTLPEPAMSLAPAGDWLYMAGARAQLYRAPLDDLGRREAFDLGARLTGVPLAVQGAVFAPTATGLVCLATGTHQAVPAGPQQTARAISPMRGRRIVVLYSAVAADGAQSSLLGLFDVGAQPPRLLASAHIGGPCSGPAQVAGDRIVVACRDGSVSAWDAAAQEDGGVLRQAWSSAAQPGKSVQCGASLSGGLIALAPCKDNDGLLRILNAGTGQVVFEQPLAGDVFVAPLWWERTLSAVIASGVVEVLRVTLLAEE